MMGLRPYCEKHLGRQLLLREAHLAAQINRAVLTGHLWACRAVADEPPPPADQTAVSLAVAAMLWASRLGWRRFPVLLTSDGKSRDRTRFALSALLAGETGKPARIDPLDIAVQVRTLGPDGGTAIAELARPLPEAPHIVVRPDFLVVDGFMELDAANLIALPKRAGVQSGVLIGDVGLVVAVGGREWLLA